MKIHSYTVFHYLCQGGYNIYATTLFVCRITPRLRNELYCVEWDVKLYYTIPYRCRNTQKYSTDFQKIQWKGVIRATEETII